MTVIQDLDQTVSPSPSLRRLTPEQVAAFDRDGLLYLPAFFSMEEIVPLASLAAEPAVRERTVRVIDSTGQGAELFGWAGVTDDRLGLYVRVARMVEVAEDLLDGEPVYHWHSKLSLKAPGSLGTWDWHQDFGSWYREGCLRPEMLTIMVAVDPTNVDNGCVELLRGSHRLGRIEHGPVGRSQGADPHVVAHALAELERVECVLESGDAVAFHANTLHASGPNLSHRPRTVLHVSYNTVRNIPSKGMPQHDYQPLDKLPDGALTMSEKVTEIDLESFAEQRRHWNKLAERGVNPYGYRVERPGPD